MSIMWRSTLILLLVLATSDAKENYRVKSWGNASVAAIDQDYYLISKNNSHISISKQIRYPNVTTCYLDFNGSHVGEIQTVGTERNILLMFKQNPTTFKLLQLDPFLCLYHPFLSLETSVESTWEPQVIVVNNTLDIFLNGHENCLPCRFDMNGNRLGVSGQLAPKAISFFKSLIIVGFIHKDNFHNYALVGNFADGTSVLKSLDHNLNTSKEKYFDHPIEALTSNSDANNSWIGITYAGLGNPRDRVLAMYTSGLELMYEKRLKPRDGNEIHDTLLSMNSMGDLAVHWREQSVDWNYWTLDIYNQKGSTIFYERWNNLNGNINATCYWQLFTLGGRFCAVIHEYYRYTWESYTDSWYQVV